MIRKWRLKQLNGRSAKLVCTKELNPKNFKEGIGSFFDHRVNALGRWPYWPSRMEVSYCTFELGAFIRRNLRILSLPRDSPARWPICVRDLSPRWKGNSRLTIFFFSGLTTKKMRKNNNSPPYVTARWPKKKTDSPFNFPWLNHV